MSEIHLIKKHREFYPENDPKAWINNIFYVNENFILFDDAVIMKITFNELLESGKIKFTGKIIHQGLKSERYTFVDILPETKITLSLRFKVLKRDNYRCCICGRDASDGVKLEIDHTIPKSKGGTNEIENLKTLCYDCNRGKGNKYE